MNRTKIGILYVKSEHKQSRFSNSFDMEKQKTQVAERNDCLPARGFFIVGKNVKPTVNQYYRLDFQSG